MYNKNNNSLLYKIFLTALNIGFQNLKKEKHLGEKKKPWLHLGYFPINNKEAQVIKNFVDTVEKASDVHKAGCA